MPKQTVDRLIFVYNADAGLLSALLDSARKVLQIKGCTLCAITHGLAGERSDWSECKAELGVPVDYLHRDEVTPELRQLIGDQLPCVVGQAKDELITLLTPAVLDRCKGSVADFKGRLQYHASLHGLVLP
ncbi:MAG TPA: hypothetical protein VHG32_07300 [Thermoanaerobaculia bacterium]|jgi:hypothetical protein|nr:hypothetical protein [Thermoanaerobaculia bacterium]